MVKKKILALLFLSIPICNYAQKITLGSCTVQEVGVKGVYKGQMAAGKPQGKGSVLFDNGNTYEGDFVKGKRHGYGIYTFSDGEKYEGQWILNQQHGHGTYYFNNNNKYVGLWF